MTVGEAFGVTLEQTSLFVDERRNELNMIFHFDLVRLDSGDGRNDGTRSIIAPLLPNTHRALSAIGSNRNVHCVTPSRRVSLAQRFQTKEPNR